MQLLDENFQKNKKGNKSKTIVLVSIIILFLLMITILILMISLKEEKMTTFIDGKDTSKLNEMLVFDESNPSKIYIPIRDIASYLGYKDYSGEYENTSESASQCYVQSEEEVANFALNSNIIYKKVITDNSNYEQIEIDEPVKAINGKLCTTMDGIEKAFNVSFSYDTDKKQITIFTMPYLINFYSSKVLDYGFNSIDENINNKKAILEDLLIVTNGEKYAVITVSGEKILEDKYEKIEYIRPTSDFLVTSNSKVGIISKTRETKVDLIYEEITPIDDKGKLYLIKKEGKYGIIDNNGSTKIYPEYDEIGIDATSFKKNGIKNSYILLDNLIPIKKGELWGIANTNGKLIADFKYEEIGYIGSNSGTENNLLVVPEYDVIVVKKGEKYTVITASKGEEIWPAAFDSIYISDSSGKISYVLFGNGKTWDLIEKLKEQGIGKKQSIKDNKQDETTATNSIKDTTSNDIIDDNNTIDNNTN